MGQRIGRPIVRCVAGAAALLAVLGMVTGADPAAAAQPVLYAAVSGTGDCSSPGNACALTTALGEVTAGQAIQLITPGSSAHYVGNWVVSTTGTSAGAPVTIEAEPGLPSAPVLDGNNGSPTGCGTTSCAGPVLTVGQNEYVTLIALTIANAHNISSGESGGKGGGLLVYGTVTVTGATFTNNTADFDGGAIDSGDRGGGSVSVTGSTFTGNTADQYGGAIDSGDDGGGSVSVTGSTFTNNTSFDGGAIDSGDSGGSGTVSVTGSTFTNNTANGDGGAIDSGDSGGSGTATVTGSTFTNNTADVDGGAIDSGDFGGGSVVVTGSTFGPGNTASYDGGLIDSGDNGGGGSVSVAADIFDGSCDQPGGGTWDDGGYNAGTDTTCFAASPPASDTQNGTVGSDLQSGLTDNGGPTQTIAPTTGSPAIGLIPDPTTVSVGGSQVQLCPAIDQRGYASAADTRCDAGAVQTSGAALLALSDTAAGTGYRQAGDTIQFRYQVTNVSGGTVTGIAVADPAVTDITCPAASLPAGSSETCTGSYQVTSADVTAGQVTDTAAGYGITAAGTLAGSPDASITVPIDWPAAVAGTYPLTAGSAEGYYLGTSGSPWDHTWTLEVTHPGSAKVTFTGTVTINAGKFTALTGIQLEHSDHASVSKKTITFTFHDYGDIDGIRFATTTAATTITFTLKVNGKPAAAGEIHLGSAAASPATGSPVSFTRN